MATKYAKVELNFTPEYRAETARRLGITDEQCERIYTQLKEEHPAYNKGYSYDRLLVYITKLGNRIAI